MRKIFIAAMVISSFFFWKFVHAQNNDQDKQVSQQTVFLPPPPDTTSFDATVNSIIAKNQHLDIGVSIVDLEQDKAYHYGVSEPFLAASVGKLLTATLILHEIETGSLDANKKIGGAAIEPQLKKLVEESDNPSWQNFNDYLGTTKLESYAHDIGLSSYNRETNTVTSDDVARLLGQIYMQKLLNPQNTKQLLTYMKNADSDQYIPAATPSPFTTYHKAGYLDDRLHDTAIIESRTDAFVLVVFTKGTNPYDFPHGTSLIHRITKSGIETFLRAE